MKLIDWSYPKAWPSRLNGWNMGEQRHVQGAILQCWMNISQCWNEQESNVSHLPAGSSGSRSCAVYTQQIHWVHQLIGASFGWRHCFLTVLIPSRWVPPLLIQLLPLLLNLKWGKGGGWIPGVQSSPHMHGRVKGGGISTLDSRQHIWSKCL